MTTRAVHCSMFSLFIGLAFCATFSVAAGNDSGKGPAGAGAFIQASALDTNFFLLSSWNETFCDNPALAAFYVAHDGRLMLAIESELGMTCLETWRIGTVKTITLSEGSRRICVETTNNDVLVEISDPDATRFEPFATNNWVTFDFDPGEKEPLHRVARQLELLTGKTAVVTDIVPSAIQRKAASFKEQMQKHARTAAAQAAASQKASSKSPAGAGVKGRLKAVRAKDTLLASWNYDDPEAGTISCNFLQPEDGSLMLICGEVDVYSWRSESINTVTLYDEDNEICVETAEGAVQEKTGAGLVGTNSSVWMYFNPTDKEKLHQVARQLELLAGQPLATENIVPAAKKEKAAAFKGQIQKQARAAAKNAPASPGVSKQHAKHSVADVKSRVKAIRAKYTFLIGWSYDDGFGPVSCDFFQGDDGYLYLTCDLYGEDPSVDVWQSEAVAAITLYEGDNENLRRNGGGRCVRGNPRRLADARLGLDVLRSQRQGHAAPGRAPTRSDHGKNRFCRKRRSVREKAKSGGSQGKNKTAHPGGCRQNAGLEECFKARPGQVRRDGAEPAQGHSSQEHLVC